MRQEFVAAYRHTVLTAFQQIEDYVATVHVLVRHIANTRRRLGQQPTARGR